MYSYRGKILVDLWGGYSIRKNPKDPNSVEKKWTRNTKANTFSVSKAITNICLMDLIQKRVLRYDDPVSKYWPEFSSEGKVGITISEIISHRSGLFYFDDGPVDVEFFKPETDPQELSKFLAKQKIKIKIEKGQSAYGAHSVGLFINQVFIRVDPKKRNLREYFLEEISPKFNGAKFYFGLNNDNREESNLARHYNGKINKSQENLEFKMAMFDEESHTRKSFELFKNFNPFKSRFCLAPSSLGYSTARDLAVLGSLLSSNFDKQVLSESLEVVTDSVDSILFENIQFTKGGFQVDHRFPGVYFHGGFGGSLFMFIPKLDIGLGLVINLLKERREVLIESFLKCLGLIPNL